MKTPSGLWPGLYGALIGGIAVTAVGFGVGGWYLGSTAESMAASRSKVAVVAALLPICISNQQLDPESADKLAALRAMNSSYDRIDFVMKAGWATMPSTEAPNRALAAACASVLTRTVSG